MNNLGCLISKECGKKKNIAASGDRTRDLLLTKQLPCRLAIAAYTVRVRVAQWIARLPPKQKVAGSTPASDAF